MIVDSDIGEQAFGHSDVLAKPLAAGHGLDIDGHRRPPHPHHFGIATHHVADEYRPVELHALYGDRDHPPTGPLRLNTGVIEGVDNIGWTLVDLGETYTSMVVVATANYDVSSPPLVVRLRNAAASSFEVRVDRADGLAGTVSGVDVYYMVVEEGVYEAARRRSPRPAG